MLLVIDPIQILYIVVSATITLITTIFSGIIINRMGKQQKKQDKSDVSREEAAQRREKIQLLNIKKNEAMFFALIMTLNNVDSLKFQASYKEKMREFNDDEKFVAAT